MNIAIATVCNSEFLDGSIVLIHSFLKHNTWFNGDILIIHEEKDSADLKSLSIFPNVRYINPSQVLMGQIDKLKSSGLGFESKYIRFLSIEIFNISEYDTILYLDSDMLCLRDVRHLFQLDSEFAACPDFRNLLGFLRNSISFKPVHKSKLHDGYDDYISSFNTGLMTVGKKFLNQETYSTLCKGITYERYAKIKTNQTDTVVLNMLFKDKVKWLDFEYNAYVRFLHQQRDKISKSNMEQLKFIHFLGGEKPWIYKTRPEEFPYNQKYMKEWLDSYEEVMGSSKVG